MPSPVKCFCTPGSTDCPESGWKTCAPDVSHCLLSLTWNETANSHIEYLQDCWPWSDNHYEMVRCPKDPGVCHLMDETTGYRTCCCLGDYCNNKTNTDIIHSKESLASMSHLPDIVEAAITTPATEYTQYQHSNIFLMVAGPSLAVIVLIVFVALLCYLRSNGFKMRQVRTGVNKNSNHDQLTLFPGRSRWYRCLPLKRNHMRSVQHTDMCAVGSIPWINRRDRLVTGQCWPTDDEGEGLTSLFKKISMKSQGCFGQVWLGHRLHPGDISEATPLEVRGKLAKLPDDVAIKVFPSNHETSWLAEVALFRLPGLAHPNILKFYGADKNPVTSNDGLSGSLTSSLEYWLVTEYHPLGSIYDYIHENTVDWNCLLGIAVGIARGLSHLHFEAPTPTPVAVTAVTNGDGCSGGSHHHHNQQQHHHHASGTAPGLRPSTVVLPGTGGSCWKPVIAHRDLNSRNILLKSNMTACIADFGLAIQFEPGHFPSLAHPKLGTRRYMAPEVLDGAIQFSRDAYLRIDVYAMGLVFWELMSRCADDGGVHCLSPYRAPYELELGPNPSMEELQRLVALEKYRPKFDTAWSGHSGMCFLWETVEECWDQDAEARLSAGCVAERLSQWLVQHPAHGVSPLDELPGPAAFASGPANSAAADADSSLRVFRSMARPPDNNVSAPNVVSCLQSTGIPSPLPTVSLTSSPLLEDLRLPASSVKLSGAVVVVAAAAKYDKHHPLIGPALSHSSVPSRTISRVPMTAIDSDPDEVPVQQDEADLKIQADNECVGGLLSEAMARKERLQQLRLRAARLRNSCETTTNNNVSQDVIEEDAALPKPMFRNYKPQSEELKEGTLPAAETVDLTKYITSQLEAANAPSVVEEVNLMSLAPRKPDWDLKRSVEKKLAKLERRTQRAIGELIRERLRNNKADLASVVSQQPAPFS